MSGDKAKCLAPGMNGYVPKPIDRERLFKAIGQNIGYSEHAEAYVSSKIGLPQVALAGFNLKDGLKRIGSWNRFAKILDQFFADHQTFPIEFKQAVTECN